MTQEVMIFEEMKDVNIDKAPADKTVLAFRKYCDSRRNGEDRISTVLQGAGLIIERGILPKGSKEKRAPVVRVRINPAIDPHRMSVKAKASRRFYQGWLNHLILGTPPPTVNSRKKPLPEPMVEAQPEPLAEVVTTVEAQPEPVTEVVEEKEEQEKPPIGLLSPREQMEGRLTSRLLTLCDLVQKQTSHLETVTLQMEGRLTSRLDTQKKLAQELRNEQRLLSQGVWRAGKNITDLLRKLGQLSVNRKVRKAVDDFQPFDQEIDSGR